MTNIRSTYTLVHNGERLLTVDASSTTPFVVGEDVEFRKEEAGKSREVFLVEKKSRVYFFFRPVAGGEQVVAREEVTIHLRRRVPTDNITWHVPSVDAMRSSVTKSADVK